MEGGLKVLVVHCDLKVGGGAEAYAKQLISVLTQRGLSVGTLDKDGHKPPHGTVERPKWLKYTWVLGAVPLSLLIYSLVCRVVPNVARSYDRVIYSFGEGPRCPCPTARICHAPTIFGRDFDTQVFLSDVKSSSIKARLKMLYSQVCFWIAQPSLSAGDGVLTIANSFWTARQLARNNWITSTLVYPPVARGYFCDFVKRKPLSIAMIGRIVPNKRFEEAVDIVRKVRDAGLDVRLTIVGRVNTAYGRRFARKYRKHSWVTIAANASAKEKETVLARATLGLHTYQHEHFGIAVGEMIHAGVLPIVFDGGGVVELAFDRALRFSTKLEAAQKIAILLDARSEYKSELVARLQRSEALNRSMCFDSEMNSALDVFLAGSAPDTRFRAA